MNATKEYLEKKISKLNEWLESNSSKHHLYKQKTFNRDFYVGKLIELEENNLKTVKI